MSNPLPFAVEDMAPIPGTIKSDYEDFLVEEIPLYTPCGEGDHVYFVVEKQGLTTHQALRDIGRALGVNSRDIGVAGNKDARGITRQMMSLEHVDPKRIEALSIPRLSILSVSRHKNKLRTGHLLGNRFTIKLRQTDVSRLLDAKEILGRLHTAGAPNYFGPQRFGNRGDTWEIGRALVKRDYTAAAAIIAGSPGPEDSGRVAEARTLFDQGDFAASASAWPRGFQECAAVAAAMHRFKGNAERAVLGLNRKTLSLYVSALQSRLFNEVMARRIDDFHTVREGDVAWKHENGAAFLVEDGEAERPRAERFEISPTGPLFGKKMKPTGGSVAAIEAEVLGNAGLQLSDFPHSGPFKCQGGRRPLRFRPEEWEASAGEDDRGPFLKLTFALGAGCYATSLLREICKTELTSAAGW